MSKLTASQLEIQGAWLFHLPVFLDERGTFREWFSSAKSESEVFPEFQIKQANTSTSKKGVIRGIHFSDQQTGQSKILTCLSGSIFDVLIDLRPDSVDFGKHISINLSANDGNSLYISKGLGHAFQALEEDTIVTYLTDKVFVPSEEFSINPLDSKLNIAWPLADGKLSNRDVSALTLETFFSEYLNEKK
jgi:dTDP-4-dehydrorhamnose 3,5-epimerase